jgi:hypothetical protein
MPAGTETAEVELRDHADDILTAVVQDIGVSQTSDEQSDKSQGHRSAHTMKAYGKLHVSVGAGGVPRASSDGVACLRGQWGVGSQGCPTLTESTDRFAVHHWHPMLGIAAPPSQGGSIYGIPVVTSGNVGGRLVALDAQGILYADDGGVELSVSREATSSVKYVSGAAYV